MRPKYGLPFFRMRWLLSQADKTKKLFPLLKYPRDFSANIRVFLRFRQIVAKEVPEKEEKTKYSIRKRGAQYRNAIRWKIVLKSFLGKLFKTKVQELARVYQRRRKGGVRATFPFQSKSNGKNEK